MKKHNEISAPVSRNTYWDTVKALLIFLVILGHVIQFFMYKSQGNHDFWSDSLFKGIYLFHMPLFMLISGFFAARSIAKHGWHALGRYLQRLALPCISMGLIFLIVALIQGLSLGYVISGCSALWFLIVLFECTVCYLIMQWKSAWWYKLAAFVLPIPLAIIAHNIPYMNLLWPYTQLFTYLWPFFILGCLLSRFKFQHLHINWKWSAFPLLYVTAYYLFQPDWYVYLKPLSFETDSIQINLFRTFAAVAGCGTAIWLSKYIHHLLGRIPLVQQIGQATLALYVLQTIFFGHHLTIAKSIPQISSYTAAFIASLAVLIALYLVYIASRHISLIAILLYGEKKRG